MLWTAISSGFLMGLLPIGLAEAVALALGAVQPPGRALILLAVFTLAHVAAKLAWYWLGTVSDRAAAKSPRAFKYIEKAREVLGKHPVYGAGVLAAAAVASLPPFHIASIASGIVRMPLWRFLSISIVGRAIRFGAIGAAPTLIRAMIE